MIGHRSAGRRMAMAAALLLAFAPAAGFMAQPVLAQVPGTKLPSGAVVPDFTGVWERPADQGIRFDPSGSPPPFTPAYAAKFQAGLAARARGEDAADPTAGCLPPGMPRMMVATYPMEVLQTRGQVTIITEWDSQVRRIFTDGRPHPSEDKLDITFNGHSIGHWEGTTLVVDTIGLHGDTSFDSTPTQHSDQMRLTERMRLVDPRTLEDQITVIDPVAFTRPWVVTRRYVRGGPDLQIMEYVCEENNRDFGPAPPPAKP
jgi:hypothetical protein